LFSSDTDDEVLCRTRSTLKLNHKSSSHGVPCPPSGQTGTAVGVLGTQPLQHINAMRSADDAAVSEPSENGRGFVNKMTPPLVMGPEAIDTDIWARGSRIPSTFENDNASDPSAFAAVHRNRPSDHPGLFLIQNDDVYDHCAY